MVIEDDLSVSEYVHHAGAAKHGLDRRYLPIDVDVAVQVQGRLEDFVQPAEGFDALVGAVFHVMDLPGRGVGDEDVQVTPVEEFVEHEAGNKAENKRPHLPLRVLIGAGVVL